MARRKPSVTRARSTRLDLAGLRRNPRIAFYFRYPLHRSDFRELRDDKSGRLLGRYAAKPLYGRLTKQGRVDRSAGFNGQVAVIFIPRAARSAERAELFLTRLPRTQVVAANGRRNWSAIHHAAERVVRKQVGREK
jgi:hypothetical protein